MARGTMATRMSPREMLATARDLKRLPFAEADLAVIRQATPAVAPKLSAKYEPSEGLYYLAAPTLHMEFVVVKSVRLSLPFGLTLPRYTIFMGFEHGEIWERGPVVNRLSAVAFIFKRMLLADSWLDGEYGRKH